MPHARLLALALAAPLFFGGTASAQHSHGYIFVGAATIPGETGYTYWHGNYIHAGGGGQFGIGERFTLGGEIGSLISTAESSGGMREFFPSVRASTSLAARGGSWILLSLVGYRLLVAGEVGGMLHFGGGANYWFHPPNWTKDGVPRSRVVSGRNELSLRRRPDWCMRPVGPPRTSASRRWGERAASR